ncbi:cytochrome P450 [Deinococcus soli (ex Cha et al. 2016)]|uniref:Cytochrome P450 n=1 Tax=Deinococcus soli (ex Cha et al. 2016) TaxID=1309411 RepID=A0A0F7JUI9_9DEIO|nr:cytochrome P450 [Deinococcus soli (ex Cha et al. 2016)]
MGVTVTAPSPLPPGPRTSPLRSALDLRRDPLGYLRHLRAAYGDAFRVRIGPREVLMVTHPDAAREVLVTQAARFRKGRGIQKMQDFLGTGLLTAEGQTWRTHRRLMQPSFHRAALSGMADDIVQAARPTHTALLKAADSGVGLEVGGEMLRVTLRAVASVLFGTGLSDGELAVVEAELPPLLDHTASRVRSVVDLPRWLPTPAGQRSAAASRALDAIVARIIAARRAEQEAGTPGNDLLGLLLAARDEEGGGLSDRELRDEVMTLFLAGHETTANTLTFLLLLLARHPDVQARVQAELRGVLGDRDPTAADLPRLPLLNACIQETLRLYPPAWLVPRQATAPVRVAGFDLPEGAAVSVCIYLLQRHAAYWPDPHTFVPDRWLRGERTPDAFMPFGLGPRMCIGNNLALMEAGLIAALLLRDVHVTVPDGGPTGLHAGVTLRPDGPVTAVFHR